MEAQTSNNKAEPVIRVCIVCGNKDTDEYCSKCGAKLEFLGDEQEVADAKPIEILKEYVGEIADPIFAYLKTTWLLLMNPAEYLLSLYFRDRPINELSFPLSSLWRRVSGKRTQYTLHPVAFFASNLIVTYISSVTLLYTLLTKVFQKQLQLPENFILPVVTSAGFLTLLQLLVTALTFDVLTRKVRISRRFMYSLWVYMFSLLWIGPVIGLPIIIVILVPAAIIILVLSIGLAILFQQARPPLSTEVMSAAYVAYLIALVYYGQFYFFSRLYLLFITPLTVFRTIYEKEQLPTNNLGRNIVISVLAPIILFYCCINQYLGILFSAVLKPFGG